MWGFLGAHTHTHTHTHTRTHTRARTHQLWPDCGPQPPFLIWPCPPHLALPPSCPPLPTPQMDRPDRGPQPYHGVHVWCQHRTLVGTPCLPATASLPAPAYHCPPATCLLLPTSHLPATASLPAPACYCPPATCLLLPTSHLPAAALFDHFISPVQCPLACLPTTTLHWCNELLPAGEVCYCYCLLVCYAAACRAHLGGLLGGVGSMWLFGPR